MNIFKITEEEKRKILNSHRSASIVKEQTNGGINFKPKTPQELAQGLSTAPAAQQSPATQQKFEFKANPNITPESGIKYQPSTPQELAKGVQAAASSAPVGKGNPMISKLQQILLDKYKIDLGKTGPNGNGVDGFLGLKTAQGIQKALEISKTSEVTNKTDTTQQKKFEFKGNPNVNSESGIRYQPKTPQELAKEVQTVTK